MYPDIKVLDHGYIRLIETWGSDERIIEAARMSTNKGFLGWGTPEKPGDEKLLNYLWTHKHATPFEMAGLIIEIQAPIFVFREWHRHRTQCLIGDTKITLVSPRGTTFKRTIKEIYDLKYGGVVDTIPRTGNGKSKAGTPVTRQARRKDAWRTRILPNCQERILRVLNEEDGTFHTAKMKDVWKSGIKEVFTVIAGNFSVIASAEHPFFTKRGWVKTKDLVLGDMIARMGKVATEELPYPPSLRSGIGVWTSMMRNRLLGEFAVCYKCNNSFPKDEIELDHVIPVIDNLKLALDENNLKPICIQCHLEKTAGEQSDKKEKTRRGIRWEKVDHLPILQGVAETYDIEVEGPHHNYCANDLVVHNSYNEMSARYIPMPNEHYLPTLERCIVVNGKNKQSGKSTDRTPTHEEALSWLEALANLYNQSELVYQEGLTIGIPKEIARTAVLVSRYSKMRASANLRNWLAFLTLRMDLSAQEEIRNYADAVALIISEYFPRVWDIYQSEKDGYAMNLQIKSFVKEANTLELLKIKAEKDPVNYKELYNYLCR